eukprot:maker-scaffold_12-snap-gene-5.30-mRNA-1 protein AED:0.01 eAED:0.01 QI:86/1/1/1/1/1/2/41/688
MPETRSRRPQKAVKLKAPKFMDSDSSEDIDVPYLDDDSDVGKKHDSSPKPFSLTVKRRTEETEKDSRKIVDKKESTPHITGKNTKVDNDSTTLGWLSTPPNKSTLRILITTDNHLGVYEKDPIRRDDSFNTMDEILSYSSKYHCDMVLLGGDLFHHNKPSRNTIIRTMEIFRRHVLQEQTAKAEKRSAIKVHDANYDSFKRDLIGNHNVGKVAMPMFIIHGNHDDPTSDGLIRSFSAIDTLQAAGLVNYYGVPPEVDKIRINPILITKGNRGNNNGFSPAKLALYGLGWMRDERLNRLFSNDQVRFGPPRKENKQPDLSWYSLFMVHQNRQNRGKGNRNCIQEEHIPEFMNLVVFGHEHDCQVDFTQSIVTQKEFSISQPGSSIATSLSPGEAKEKHVIVLEIQNDANDSTGYRHKAIKLRTVRPFIHQDIILNGFKELDVLKGDTMKDVEMQTVLSDFLEEQVRNLIQRAKEEFSHSSMKPLIRLRVDYTGFFVINAVKFGAKFASDIANPSDVLSFHRRMERRTNIQEEKRSVLSEDIVVQYREKASDKIGSLLEESLSEEKELGLNWLHIDEVNKSLHQFVHKSENGAIEAHVNNWTDNVRKKLAGYFEKFNEHEFLDAVKNVQKLGTAMPATKKTPARLEIETSSAMGTTPEHTPKKTSKKPSTKNQGRKRFLEDDLSEDSDFF